ncbi:hypothetical protein Hanom_Chr11g01055031 [Helianthus anomalus]
MENQTSGDQAAHSILVAQQITAVHREVPSLGGGQRTFVLRGTKGVLGPNLGSQVEVGKLITIPENTIAFHLIHDKALVVRTVDLDTLTIFDRLLCITVTRHVNIQYMRGLNLLLTFEKQEEAAEFRENQEVRGLWFSSFDFWYGQTLPFERIA